MGRQISTKKFAANVVVSVIAQIISLAVSFLLNLVIPKFIDEYAYSYWQMYVLYVGYVGVLHFGLLDGLVLRYGAYDYDELDRARIRSQFKFLLFTTAALALLIAAFSVIGIFLVPVVISACPSCSGAACIKRSFRSDSHPYVDLLGNCYLPVGQFIYVIEDCLFRYGILIPDKILLFHIACKRLYHMGFDLPVFMLRYDFEHILDIAPVMRSLDRCLYERNGSRFCCQILFRRNRIGGIYVYLEIRNNLHMIP